MLRLPWATSTSMNAVQQSEIYPYLRDRDVDADEAEKELRNKIDELLEQNAKTAPLYLEASQNWENFKDWLVEDIFQRTYQDVITDRRDAVALYQDVELLLNSVERCIAIRPCDKNNPNAIRWGRLKEGRWCASTLGCRGLAKTLFDIMEWDEDLRYRFRGQFLEQGDNKMMLFAFDEPEMIKVEEIVLPPKENTEEDEGETVKKKIYIFPPEWAGTFGQPITSIAQVGILRQEHYAGNWDVFRPATEIEEMNIFTAESLNELLREAEKIMEGWTDYR